MRKKKYMRREISILSFVLVSFLMALVVPGALYGQATATPEGITGFVHDTSHAVIPGATITVKNTATGVVTITHTSGTGVFSFPNLTVGTYNVTVSKQGFKTVQRLNVRLLLGTTPNLDILLPVGSLTQTVTVSATSAPVLDTTSTATGTTEVSNDVVNLPVLIEYGNRTPLSFIQTMGGVAYSIGYLGYNPIIYGIGDGGDFAIETAYRQDGVFSS
jgi:hypothetical protein